MLLVKKIKKTEQLSDRKIKLEESSNSDKENKSTLHTKMLSSHLRIGTFNLLAPCYNRLRFQEQPTFLEPSKVIVQKLDNESENHLYTFLESVTPARYKSRTLELLSSVISKMECDVMCFQEFWMTKEMKDMFENYLIKEKQFASFNFFVFFLLYFLIFRCFF